MISEHFEVSFACWE